MNLTRQPAYALREPSVEHSKSDPQLNVAARYRASEPISRPARGPPKLCEATAVSGLVPAWPYLKTPSILSLSCGCFLGSIESFDDYEVHSTELVPKCQSCRQGLAHLSDLSSIARSSSFRGIVSLCAPAPVKIQACASGTPFG